MFVRFMPLHVMPENPMGPLRSVWDIVDRLKVNSQNYWKDLRVLVCLVLVTGAMDAFSTVYFMTRDGADQEVHPVVRLVSVCLGPILGPLVGKIADGLSRSGDVQDWNVAAGNSATICRILFHTSSRPAPVFAEKGITGAAG